MPLGAAIWSANPTTFTQFPADTFMRFCDNHGLLTYRNRPAWRTVTGGAANYVRALSAPIADKIHRSSPVSSISRGDNCARLAVGGATLDFDHVIIACHSDQALAMLSDPSDLETASLRAIRYQPNTATLHTDRSLLPQSNRAQASWNYHVRGPNAFEAVLTYNMNRLQNIQSQTPILVTLNGRDLIASETVIAEFTYEHPIFDAAAVVAQGRHRDICTSLTSFCGAYWGYGFHEDGAVSGLRVAQWLGAQW